MLFRSSGGQGWTRIAVFGCPAPRFFHGTLDKSRQILYKKLVYKITRSYYAPLAAAGVRIYEYTPGFIHAKQCVCDDELAVIGTINLDYRSLYLHFENGVLMYKTKVVSDMKTYPLSDFVKRELAVTLNTDNPAISSTTIANEFAYAQSLGITLAQEEKMLLTAVDAAFTDKATKDKLKQLLCKSNSIESI